MHPFLEADAGCQDDSQCAHHFRCDTKSELLNAIEWAHTRRREWRAETRNPGWEIVINAKESDPPPDELRRIFRTLAMIEDWNE